MKNDRYFPLEICFWAGDNLSVMMYQTGGVQLVGIYVLLLYLCAKNDYSKSVVNSMQKPVEKVQWKKTLKRRWIKGKNRMKPKRVEEKYYYCCKQQQQYWRGKEDCCCCCSNFGFGE